MALAGLLPLNRYGERRHCSRRRSGCARRNADASGGLWRLPSVGRTHGKNDRAMPRTGHAGSPPSAFPLRQALYMVGRNEEADRVLRSTLEMWPDATSLRLLKIKSALWTRRYEEAIQELDAADLPLTSTKRQTLAAAFAALKSSDSALRSKSVADLQAFAADPRCNDKVVVGTLAALGARSAALQAAANLVRAPEACSTPKSCLSRTWRGPGSKCLPNWCASSDSSATAVGRKSA